MCHFRALAYIHWHACGIYGSNVFTEQISKEKYVQIDEYIAPEPELYKQETKNRKYGGKERERMQTRSRQIFMVFLKITFSRRNKTTVFDDI